MFAGVFVGTISFCLSSLFSLAVHTPRIAGGARESGEHKLKTLSSLGEQPYSLPCFMEVLKETLLRSDFDRVRQHPKYKVRVAVCLLARTAVGLYS